jgi:hypothetical protein
LRLSCRRRRSWAAGYSEENGLVGLIALLYLLLTVDLQAKRHYSYDWKVISIAGGRHGKFTLNTSTAGHKSK